jgi:hypothetical protein
MLRGVLDANMVIGLVKGGVFDLLPSLYAPLYIPVGVKQEVLTGQGRPGEAELAQALQAWITEVSPDLGRVPRVSASLSTADREVLAVAADPAMAIDHVLTGDDPLYQQAERLGYTSLSVTDVHTVPLPLVPAHSLRELGLEGEEGRHGALDLCRRQPLRLQRGPLPPRRGGAVGAPLRGAAAARKCPGTRSARQSDGEGWCAGRGCGG